MTLERRRVRFSGRVQGVGFRATCRWLAGGFKVNGHVRNLPDGSVELVAEGDSSELERFLEAVNSAMGGFIHDLVSSQEPFGDPPLEGFHVRV